MKSASKHNHETANRTNLPINLPAMKKTLILICAAIGMLAASCTPQNRTVENPFIEAANTETLDIAKIDLSDTATVLHINAYFRPKNWIRIDSKTYLQADGVKYPVTGTEEIQLDSLFWMPETGRASFVLKFGPLPKRTKSFDFIESDCDDCFKVYGVDLTGKKKFEAYPEKLPSALRSEPKDGAVPDPILEVGETTVNLHLLGFHEGMFPQVSLYLNSPLSSQKELTADIDPQTSVALTLSIVSCFITSPLLDHYVSSMYYAKNEKQLSLRMKTGI